MSNDSTTALNTPIVEDGLRRIPFFNGRVLTAEDLKIEQDANTTERSRLGRALGTGVLEGLFVDRGSGDPPTTVTVEPGLALAPSGRIVELPRKVELSVVSEIDREATAGTKGQFADCSAREVVITSGTGAYLLFAEPASEPEGRTPRTRLGGDGAAGACGAQYRVEGARLRLVHLDTGDPALVPESLQTEQGTRTEVERSFNESDDPAPKHRSKLRNVLAHVCLRTPSALTDTASLYDTLRRQSRGNASASDGPVDVLRDRADQTNDGLDDAVPLGLLYWSDERIAFVDVWSVRRRVHRPDPRRPVPATDRRSAEAEAALYQFQKHLADLVRREMSGGVAEIGLKDHFRFIPAVSLVPLVNSAGLPGVLPEAFLDDVPARDPMYTEGRRVSRLLRAAILTPPIDLARRTALRTYYVRENAEQSEAGGIPSEAGSDGRVPYMILACGSLPFIGDPRFNLADWDHAHFPEPGDL